MCRLSAGVEPAAIVDTRIVMEEGGWQDLGPVEQFTRQELTEVTLGRTTIAVSCREGVFGAVSGVCNHVGGPLGQGRLDQDYIVLAHQRRRVVHFNVTEHPTAQWTAAQLIQAFPWDTAPRYLLRDRDRIYGNAFRTQAVNMAITEVLTAPQSPWQSPYVERLIGSIRRECLDHVIVADEASLRRHVASYLSYYRSSRCHLSLEKDSPDGRAIQPPELGPIVAVPMVGGLHHRYERRAA